MCVCVCVCVCVFVCAFVNARARARGVCVCACARALVRCLRARLGRLEVDFAEARAEPAAGAGRLDGRADGDEEDDARQVHQLGPPQRPAAVHLPPPPAAYRPR